MNYSSALLIRASHLPACPLLPPSVLGFQPPQNLVSFPCHVPSLHQYPTPTSSFPSLFSLSFTSHLIALLCLNLPLLHAHGILGLRLLSGCTLACSGQLFSPTSGLLGSAGENHSPRRLALLQTHHLQPQQAARQPGNPFRVPVRKLVLSDLLSISHSLSFAEKIEAIRQEFPHPPCIPASALLHPPASHT